MNPSLKRKEIEEIVNKYNEGLPLNKQIEIVARKKDYIVHLIENFDIWEHIVLYFRLLIKFKSVRCQWIRIPKDDNVHIVAFREKPQKLYVDGQPIKLIDDEIKRCLTEISIRINDKSKYDSNVIDTILSFNKDEIYAFYDWLTLNAYIRRS